ncbi:MAG: hypothetical protein KDK51_04905, partial [Deltaproteobacteria bacterium]|nr:hypothetical protein [Deltaproteobacteria bacterium]
VVKPEAMKIARANIEAKRMEAFEDWVYHNRKESSQSWKCTMTDWLRAHFEAYDDGDLYKQFTGLNSYEELVEMIKNR